jgi:NAD(P)-dependent dehydrogenase (short-subunit alcohol dehydrogenase family)
MARTILITGANRGIGLGLTTYFLNLGERVVATARDPDASGELQSLAADFNRDGQCAIETLDINSDLSVKALALKLASLKCLDVLVNNAGIIGERETSFAELSLKDVLNTINVNAVGSMRVTQAMLPLLKKSAKPVVANMTSKMGSISDNTSGSYYGYRMSKAALNMFNKSFSCDFPEITSIVMHPGWVKTDMGGASAPVGVLDRVKKSDSGKFFDFRDHEIAW